ncbi:MAG TPA: biopolymer transporter ExbD [Microscillaceae bacterium]|nr:biopolymer transporter ExbD [Microscillaceae bacterium]
MAKFGRKNKTEPAISTASLPDIVFMLLFFFMVTTVLRETDIKLEQRLPKATQLQKIEKKSLVSYIYVGKPKNSQTYGADPKVQLNDAIITSVDLIPDFISKERAKLTEAERDQITISLKVDSETKMGILTDVKLQLREADARKVNYATVKDSKR